MSTTGELRVSQRTLSASVPGLKRRCILDRNEQIAQKQAIVSFYDDETPESIEATRLMCSNTGNEFIE